MATQLRMVFWHCRRMFLVACVLGAVGYAISPQSVGGRFWVGSAWLILSPMVLLCRYKKAQYTSFRAHILCSPTRSWIHLIECLVSFSALSVVSFLLNGGLTMAGVALSLWAGSIVALTATLEQTRLRPLSIFIIASGTGLMFWTSPFWLGAWLGEPEFSPWLASWVMWLHPVSQALALSGASNLIEPIFYSLTFIGVVEVELFDPHWGLLCVAGIMFAVFGLSYVLNRRRSVFIGGMN